MDGYVQFLVTVCLCMVGSWYLQKSTLKGEVMDQIKTLTGEVERLKSDIKEQKNQITDQNTLIKDLKSKYEESTKVSIYI